jgi:hypothetical protein
LSDEHYFTFFCCSGSDYCLCRFDPLCDEQQGRRSFALIFALDPCRLIFVACSFLTVLSRAVRQQTVAAKAGTY